MDWNKTLKKFAARTVGAMLLCSVACFGQAAHAQMDKVGIIDEAELADGYKVYKDAKQALDARLQELEAQVPARQWLDETSAARFDTLIKKDSLTQLEKTELSKLVTAGLDRNNRYIKLAALQTRTPEETQEQEKLVEDAKRNGISGRTLSDDLQQMMQTTDRKLDKDYMDKALSVIKQIAAAKGLQVVLRKDAVIWNVDAIDITTEAITAMNK